MENRRNFIKKAVVGLLGMLGIGTRTYGLPEIDPEDYPPMPKVKPPKIESTCPIWLDEGGCLDSGKWHHFIYTRVGDKEEMYLDGKKVTSIVFDEGYDIKNFCITVVGDVSQEEFWFRRKNANSIPRTS
jgi:hypothetical protein